MEIDAKTLKNRLEQMRSRSETDFDDSITLKAAIIVCQKVIDLQSVNFFKSLKANFEMEFKSFIDKGLKIAATKEEIFKKAENPKIKVLDTKTREIKEVDIKQIIEETCSQINDLIDLSEDLKEYAKNGNFAKFENAILALEEARDNLGDMDWNNL